MEGTFEVCEGTGLKKGAWGDSVRIIINYNDVELRFNVYLADDGIVCEAVHEDGLKPIDGVYMLYDEHPDYENEKLCECELDQSDDAVPGVRDHLDCAFGVGVVPEGWHLVERCDMCERFGSDHEAAASLYQEVKALKIAMAVKDKFLYRTIVKSDTKWEKKMNYYATARTSYAKMKNPKKFEEWTETIPGATVITQDGDNPNTEKLYALLFDECGIPNWRYMDLVNGEEDEEFDIYEEIQGHLAHGWAITFMESGAEGNRYVHGHVVVVYKDRIETMCLTQWAHEKLEACGGLKYTDCEY